MPMSEQYEQLVLHWTRKANPYMRSRPEMIESLARFVEYGIRPGAFLTSVLNNDLREACAHADIRNQDNLVYVVEFCWNNLPRTCWGSPEVARKWVSDKANAR